MRTHLATVVVVASLLLLPSCSTQQSGVEPKEGQSPAGVEADSPQERRLLAAVRDYNEAFHTGDYKSVFRMQSELCRSLSWEDGLSIQVKQAARRYGEPQRVTSFRARMKPRIAFVTYSFEDRRLNRRGELWTSTGDGWRYSDC